MEKYRIVKETVLTEEGEIKSWYVIEGFYPYLFRKGGSWSPRTRTVHVSYDYSFQEIISYKTLKQAQKILKNLNTKFAEREILDQPQQ